MPLFSLRSSVSTVVLWALLTSLASAKCNLPVPDGGKKQPSAPNVAGKIIAIQANVVTLTRKGSDKYTKVVLPDNPMLFTAFGGDLVKGELAVGQRAEVWFSGCQWPKAGLPVSAYFQIFSKDPNDHP